MSRLNLHLSAALLAAIYVFSFALSAHAQNNVKVRKSTTTVITKESDSDVDDDQTIALPVVEAEPKESVKTASFGSKGLSGTAGCKTEELSKGLIKDLKADCNAWVKDQKSELKSKYLTSACEESCDDCGMSLRRCTVNGSVHYLLK